MILVLFMSSLLLVSTSCNRNQGSSAVPPQLPPAPEGIFVTHEATNYRAPSSYHQCMSYAREMWEEDTAKCSTYSSRYSCKKEASELHQERVDSCNHYR